MGVGLRECGGNTDILCPCSIVIGTTAVWRKFSSSSLPFHTKQQFHSFFMEMHVIKRSISDVDQFSSNNNVYISQSSRGPRPSVNLLFSF
jgi:hypothetical protein